MQATIRYLRPLDRPSLAATLIIAPPLAGLLWWSGAVSMPAAAGAMLLFVFVAMLAGFLLLRAAGAHDMPAPAAWVLGIFATAIAIHALVAWFQLLAAAAFAIWAVVVLVTAFLLRKSAPIDRRTHGDELLGLLLVAGTTVIWCCDIAQAPQFVARDGLLTTWTDQFTHGALISQFGDPRAAGRQSIELADVPIPLYHYASYMLPAAFAWPLDLPGLTLGTSVWLPVGFFTLCAGGYALGAALAGPAGGIAALGVLTLLPDAGSYGLHNRLFGYYWYVLAVPGASYGVAVALLSIAFLQRWSKARDAQLLLVSACLVIGAALMRIHVFALAFPAWLMCVAISLRMAGHRKLIYFAAGSVAFALFVWGFYGVFPDSVPALEPFLDVAHNQQEPTTYPGLYRELIERYGRSVAIPAGIALIFPASLGAFVVLYPVSVLLKHRSRGLEAMDLLPVAFVLCYLLLMTTAPISAHGDSTEWTQRPFVVLYAVVAVWTAAGFVDWVASKDLRSRRVWLPFFLAATLAVTLIFRYSARDWRWALTHKLAQGLPAAAVFLRDNWRPGEVLAAQGLKLGLVTTDPAIELVSLTGIPAYLARPYVHVSRGGRTREVAMERYAALMGVAREETAAAALSRLRELGIQWYVVTDREGPRWDAERRHAAFVDGVVAVYSTRE